MTNNIDIAENLLSLDLDFFKINMMFETVNKMYDIKMKELEYNYVYTESINETYVNLYTEAEEAKNEKQQGLLGRLFTAILNFIRSIRAKILRFFGNDKKAAELEAKIKGNPELANQTVEITNTTDAEKAIDEGTSFFGSLIDKIVGGTATEADADAAEEKSKSLLSRIGIFAGGALLAAGGAKVANDKLHITEKLGNLLKREEDTKKKSNEVTQTNEQNVQKAQQAMNNNSQNGNEENTKAGRRIVSSFKDFITGAGKFFTGKASELRSKINGVSSNNNDDNTGDNKGSSKSSNNRYKSIERYESIVSGVEKNDVRSLRESIGTLCYTSRDFSSGEFDDAIKYVENKGIKLREPYNGKPELILNKKDLSECTEDDFGDAVFELKENFCTERINEVKKIGKYVYGPGGKAKKNDKTKPETQTDKPEETQSKTKPEDKVEKQPETQTDKPEETQSKTNTTEPSKTQKTNDKQQMLTSQERPKNTNTQQANDDTQQTEQKNLTSEEQKEFDKYKEENETLKQEIRGYINNKNNIKIAYFKQQKFYATEKDYNIKLKGQRHPEIKPSMTLEKIKEYNQKFKNHRDEIKESYEMRMKISEDENKEKTPNKVEKNLETQNNTEKKYNGHGHDEIAPLQGDYKSKIYGNVHEISSPYIGNELTSEEKEIAKKLYDKSKNKTLTYGDVDQIEKLYKKYRDNTSSSFSCSERLSTLLTDPDFTQHLTHEEKIKLEEIDNRAKNKTTIQSDNTYVRNLFNTTYNKLSSDVKKQRREKNKSDKKNKSTKTSKNETDQSKDSQVESDESKTQDDTSNKKNKCADFKNQPSDVKSLVKDAHILMSTVKDFVKTYFKIRIKSGGYDFYLLDEKQGEEILRHVGLYEQGSFIGRLDAGNKKYEAAVNDVINYSEYVLKFKDKYSSKEFYKAKGQESKYDDDDYESEDEDVEEVYEEIEEKLKKVKKQLPALKNVMFESSYDLINDILTIFENSSL